MKTAILVGVAGAIGAICRMTIGVLFAQVTVFPIATLIVNLIGTLLLCMLSAGAIWKITANKSIATAIMTGFLGSFTTFSAFSYETVTLFQQGAILTASLYVMGSIFGGLVIGMVGLHISRKMVEA
ncbi:CrcB family protein [Sporosarcina sp. Sa2YVA2]|uniref:Fluoride-specific ion channel FluC n=1 Tax=Sporosarcina quadrami TaxID=2762234 RepID=A0ABR8UCI0_9BACL|nr:CrcB family protein [Sporosarcina quadrami]MBD7985530.1 CrcB family protein [Sporosarcina quadrami]